MTWLWGASGWIVVGWLLADRYITWPWDHRGTRSRKG